MPHKAKVLKKGDTLYVGTLTDDGEYLEVRLSRNPHDNKLLVTLSGGDPDKIVVTGRP